MTINNSIKETLIAYAVKELANWAGQQSAASSLVPEGLNTNLNLEAYRTLLIGGKVSNQHQEPLISLLSYLKPPHPTGKLPTPTNLTARPLALDLETLSGSAEQDPQLWPQFSQEFKRLSPNSPSHFETFTHLFYKYAWAVPCTYGEKGISLYEEFKALSALVHASRSMAEPAETFLLVGGDLSGIQKFIYTVTHKAAARGLRGRSFFLQLLSDGIVRAILRELQLPWTNVIYAAGGTFLILAPNNQETKTLLKELVRHFDATLLATAEGDLRVVIGWASIDQKAVGDPDAWSKGLQEMHQIRSLSKKRPFAETNWDDVFQPRDEDGKRYCVICHRGLKEGQGKPLESEENKEEVACNLCHSFSGLADKIGSVMSQDNNDAKNLWMIVEPKSNQTSNQASWSDLLIRLAKFRYDFVNSIDEFPKSEHAIIYALNELDFLANQAHGFRLLANVTPRMTPQDVEWATKKLASGEIFYQDEPKKGHVRDLDVMARDAQGVKWTGILRMDVDNLGAVFSQWQPARALAGTSALSSAMDLFFGGQLNQIVREIAMISDEKENEERLAAYVIYAGGDDLFIVGAWDRMVALAEQIHKEFGDYTHNPNLTISAGISLMDRPKFPLYLAAKQAKIALDDKAKAKRWELNKKENGRIYEQANDSENAICFLDTVIGWERWQGMKKVQEELVSLCDNGVPRALIQLVRNIYAQYERGRKEYEETQIKQGKTSAEIRAYPMFHGRWMWMAAYSLFRLTHRYLGRTPQLENRLKGLQQIILDPVVTPYIGLAARWTEYLTRKQN